MSVLRVLRMSTHGCFAPPFPPLLKCCDQMMDPRSQLPPLMATTTPMEPTTTWRTPIARSSSVAPRQEALPFRSSLVFVLAFLRQNLLTYVCTQILLLPLTRLLSSFCIRALEAPGL